jgi:hypothetical protein
LEQNDSQERLAWLEAFPTSSRFHAQCLQERTHSAIQHLLETPTVRHLLPSHGEPPICVRHSPDDTGIQPHLVTQSGKWQTWVKTGQPSVNHTYRRNFTNEINIVVNEFGSDRQLPVHYTLPAYYVCQCLAKMVVLHTDLLIFRIPETVRPSTKYISVRLWESIWKEAVELYDVKDPVKLKSTRPVKNDKRRNSQIR